MRFCSMNNREILLFRDIEKVLVFLIILSYKLIYMITKGLIINSYTFNFPILTLNIVSFYLRIN